jgi:hypothetical protein
MNYLITSILIIFALLMLYSYLSRDDVETLDIYKKNMKMKTHAQY